MKKFNQWNEVKKMLDEKSQKVDIHEGELWWVSIGINIGSEQDGKGDTSTRPVLVYYKIDENNFYGIPFSTTPQRDQRFTEKAIIEGKTTYALLKHIRDYSIKRLDRKIGFISDKVYDNIIYKVLALKPRRFYQKRIKK